MIRRRPRLEAAGSGENDVFGRSGVADTRAGSESARKPPQPQQQSDPATPNSLGPLVRLMARQAALRYHRHRGLGMVGVAICLGIAAILLAILFATTGGGVRP